LSSARRVSAALSAAKRISHDTFAGTFFLNVVTDDQ